MDGIQAGGTAQQPLQGQKGKGIPGSTIKIIAVAAMLIDHIGAFVLTRMIIERGYFYSAVDVNRLFAWLKDNWLLYFGMMLMRLIGRLGFPIFCFLLVEGFEKTSNIKKYVFRLGLFALISEIPFNLANTGRVWASGYQNVYFTLFIGILALCAFDAIAKLNIQGKWLQALFTAGGVFTLPLCVALRIRDKVTRMIRALFFSGNAHLYEMRGPILVIIWMVLVGVMLAVWIVYRRKKGPDQAWRMCGSMAALAVAMTGAALLRTDYGGMGVLTIAVMYALRKNKVRSMLGGCITLTIMSLDEVTAFFTLIPISRYNGERGLKMKYFFYIFYPAHLLILWLICLAMGLGGISVV